MNYRNLFIVRFGRAPGIPTPAKAPPPEGAAGVFITPQSLVTFPVASFIITMIWWLVKRLFPAWGASDVVPLVVAFLVGAVIFLITTSDPQAAPKSTRMWLIAILVALVNSLYLAAAALGYLEAAS